jgi:hypothetical protein
MENENLNKAKKPALNKTDVMRCFSKIKYFFRNRKYDVYCPYCSSCGETGCCPPTMCTNHQKGKYCGYNQDMLKVSYWTLEDIKKWLYNEKEKVSKEDVYLKIREFNEQNLKELK